MRHGYNIGLKLTKTQTVLGWLFLPFYLVLTSWGLQQLAKLLQLSLTELQLNVLYFAVNFVFVLAVYSRFLLKSFRGFTEHFWKFIQTVILGFALYYCTNLAFVKLAELFAGPVPNFNDATVGRLISQNKTVMLLCTVVAAPITEEVLVRGVVFGSLHRVNRVFAYAVSILLFCAIHVWQYYATAGLVPILLSALRYLPASIALGWTYEKSSTIWAPIVLHAIINAIAFGVTLFS